MAAVVGTMYATPSAPSGINMVSAASGPYAAELSASRPKMGIPAAGPMRLALFFPIRKRLAEQQVEERHQSI